MSSPGRHAARLKLLVVLMAATAAVAGLAGCASVGDAKPESTTFKFTSSTLDVRSHETGTDLVTADRSDVQLTRWFFSEHATGVKLSWSLRGNVLDLQASCSGFANCDAKFRVEVPRGVRVLRDGEPTKLTRTVETGR
jgi:hypothetical protein